MHCIALQIYKSKQDGGRLVAVCVLRAVRQLRDASLALRSPLPR